MCQCTGYEASLWADIFAESDYVGCSRKRDCVLYHGRDAKSSRLQPEQLPREEVGGVDRASASASGRLSEWYYGCCKGPLNGHVWGSPLPVDCRFDVIPSPHAFQHSNVACWLKSADTRLMPKQIREFLDQMGFVPAYAEWCKQPHTVVVPSSFSQHRLTLSGNSSARRSLLTGALYRCLRC